MDKCILCENRSSIKVLQKIKTSKINDLYIRSLGVDVLSEFKNSSEINYVKCINCNLHFFQPISNGSSEFYETLQKATDFYYKNNRYEFFYAKEFIKKSDKVLEIGAGNANFAELIDPQEYIGLEYNEEAIREARKKNITLINKSIEKYAEEKQNYYDVVCSFQVLEHVPNPKDFIEASLKTLKKGGLLIFGVPSAESILTNNLNHTLNFPPHHITRWYDNCLYKFKDIFDVQIVEIKHEPLVKRFFKNYLANSITNRIFRLYLKKKRVIYNDNIVVFMEKLTKKIISKLKLLSHIKLENRIGESVIMILRKN